MNVIGVRCRASCKEALFHYNPVRTTALPYLDRACFTLLGELAHCVASQSEWPERGITETTRPRRATSADVTRRFESIDARPSRASCQPGPKQWGPKRCG